MKTHKTAVVVIPPFEIWDPIQEIRRKHDRKIDRWMPHVTLLYPFVVPEEFDRAAGRIGAACAGVAPFTVRLATFRFFDHGHGRYTACLVPDPTEALVRLHAALVEAIPECDDTARYPGGFHPHLSVGQFRRRVRAREFVRERRRTWDPSTFDVREVSLIERGDPPDDVFRLDRTVPLGRSAT